jgi:hypothetical protein
VSATLPVVAARDDGEPATSAVLFPAHDGPPIEGLCTGQFSFIHQPSGGQGAKRPLLLSIRGQQQPMAYAFGLPGLGVSLLTTGLLAPNR